MSQAEQRMRVARAKAAYLRPYFDSALYAHVLVESKECPTLSVDRWKRMYFNPDFVMKMSVEQLVPILLHEIGHSLRRHHERARGQGVTAATMAVANVAMDAELNDDIAAEIASLKDMPHLPGFAIYPSTLGAEDDKLWEVYYHDLLEQEKDVQFARSGQEHGDGSCGNASSRGNGGESESGSGQTITAHDCGSAAHGVPRSWESGDPSTEGAAEGVSDADWNDVEKITAEKIVQHHHRSRGTIPKGWKEWAEDLLRPRRIPWDQELSAKLRWAVADTAGKVFHTYRRPSRRSSAVPDIVLPSMRKPKPFVCIIGDTSGSMTATHDLALVRGVAEDICAAMGATVAFLATDAEVHGGVQKVHGGRGIKIAGRGGTDMRVGIDYALTSLQPRPDVIVVVTDCGTPWPSQKPRNTRLIVCATSCEPDDTHESLGVPTWARLIVVDPDNTSSKK